MKRFLLFSPLKVCIHMIDLLIHVDTFLSSIWRKRPFTYPHLLFDKDTYATQNFIENYVLRSRLKLWDEIPSFYYLVVMLLECQYTQDIHKCTKRWSMSELITTCIIIYTSEWQNISDMNPCSSMTFLLLPAKGSSAFFPQEISSVVLVYSSKSA